MPKPAQKAAAASTQSNLIDTSGATSIDIAVTGTQAGAMHHIGAGNFVTATQSNNSVQKAAGQGDGSLILQGASQSNLIDASGNATLVLVIEGNHKGAIHHIDVGNIVTGQQSNDALQLAAQGGAGSLAIQDVSQSNVIDGSGDSTLQLIIGDDQQGAIHHIHTEHISGTEQSNEAVQISLQGSSDWIL